jgi:hypothetical protein
LFFEGEEVLFRENLGGGHEGGLESGFDDAEHGGEGDGGFAGTDVSLEEAMHGNLRGEIGADFGDGLLLGAGELEGEAFEPILEKMGFGRDVHGAGLGEVIEAASRDVELEGEELFEGEVSAGGEFLFLGFGEVDVMESVVSGEGMEDGSGGVLRQEVGDGAGIDLLEEMMDESAEGTLGDAGGERVDGDNAVDVYGRALEVGFDDFVFGVIDDETLAGELWFAVGDEFVVDGYVLGDPGEVEPAEDDGVGKGRGFFFLDGGFEDLFAAEAAERAVRDDAVDTDRGGGGGVGKVIELAAVFVSAGEAGEEIAHGVIAGFLKAGAFAGLELGVLGVGGGAFQGVRLRAERWGREPQTAGWDLTSR